jgi:uncharacterized metal-binding protein YceD (DUF177 family)
MQPKPEFSRTFPVDKLRDREIRERIEANEEERADLAARMGIVAIPALEADLRLRRIQSGNMVEVTGEVNARVVQTCVVTLEPFETAIREEVSAYFGRADDIPDPEEVQIDEDKSPEPIGSHGEIDLGELAAQHLSLALDPYPRKPGVVFKEIVTGEETAPPNPFAVLAELRPKNPDKTGK